MKLNLVETNNCYVIVEPRRHGNFGCFSISGLSRSAAEEKYLCKEIIQNIKRHIDDIKTPYIKEEYVYEFDGITYESIYDAMYSILDEDEALDFGGSVWGKRCSTDEHGVVSKVDSFKDLVEWAYDYPYEFSFGGILSENERNFLNRVIAWRKAN